MNILNKINKILNKLPLADCPLCHEIADENGLCAACWADMLALQETRPVCPVCAEPCLNGDVCGACVKNPPHFDALYAVFRYQEPLITLLQQWKYHAALPYSGVISALFKLVLPKLPTDTPFDGVLAVPPSSQRLVEHGFDHTAVLGKSIAQALNIPLISPKKIHRQHRVPQASLNRKQRLSNLKNSFSVHFNATDKHILLIDDVATTGSTLNELSGCLKKNGAKSVSAVVLSRRYKD